MAKRTIDDVDVAGLRVLMRVDFNVPMKDGVITDDRRIREALPSIRSVLERDGRIVLMSHLGRPEGIGYEPQYSLEACAQRLTELLGDSIRDGMKFPSHDCTDGAAHAAVNMLADGEGLLLENLRFHKGEKKGDDEFARTLQTAGSLNTLPLEIWSMTLNVTSPALYALGTVTTIVSFLIIGLALGSIVLIQRRRAARIDNEA